MVLHGVEVAAALEEGELRGDGGLLVEPVGGEGLLQHGDHVVAVLLRRRWFGGGVSQSVGDGS